jgi:6-phosphogluconolactonase
MLKIFSTKSELAVYFCDELVKLVSQKNEYFLCLSGGSTPEIIFQTLSKEYNEQIDWAKVHLFWGDERCVSPDSDESNYGMTKKYLLNFIDIPEKNVHRIKGENNPEAETKRYSEEIKNIVSLKNGFPNFDLVMLGLGEDGHTASIFPNQIHVMNSDKICEVSIYPLNRQKRISLTGKVINNSQKIIFLVTGKSKAEILKKIVEENKKIFPAEFIKPVSGKLQYYIDSNAASLLKKREKLS